MIISKSKKFIFIHNQKTAGTSIENYLKSSIPDTVDLFPRHVFAREGRKKLDLEWDEYFKFGFVRNPWDRLVSWYSMIIERPNLGTCNKFWKYVREKSNNFESFIINCSDTVYDEEHGILFPKSAAINQYDYFANSDDDLIVDFIGKFENLKNDFNYIQNILKLPHALLPKLNVTINKKYQDFYNDRTKKIVAERFKKDIDFFGYKF